MGSDSGRVAGSNWKQSTANLLYRLAKECGAVSIKSCMAKAPIYEEILEFASFTMHEFVGDRFRFYSDQFPSNPAINGRIFEYLICETLAGGHHAFLLSGAPGTRADFDVVLYHPTKPVVLTLKVW